MSCPSADEGTAPRLRRRADIQGLRALAVGLVILEHARGSVFVGGFIGVDVFFVVSGFLISSLLLQEAASSGRVRIGAFYARRARRILPAASVVLAATCVFAAYAWSPSRVDDVATDARWAAVFAANVHFSRLGTDYFELGRAVSPLQHFWSLAVEEQFYLIWPVVLLTVLVARRGSTVLLSLLTVSMWVASLATSLVLTPRSPTEAYFSSVTRAWELVTGVLLALSVPVLAQIPRWMRHVLVTVGLAAIAAAATLYDGSTMFPGWRALLPVLSTAAVLAAGTNGAVGAGRLLAWRPLTYMGDISYSLYLWHWPVFVFGAAYVDRLSGPADVVTLIGVTAALAVVSYHAVEQPVRRSRRPLLRDRRPLALWPLTVSFVLLVSTWSVTHATDAFEARVAGGAGPQAVSTPQAPAGTPAPLPIRQQITDAIRRSDANAPLPFPLVNFDNLVDDVWKQHFKCYVPWDDVSAPLCPAGDLTGERTMVVFGDSHAGMWLPPLATIAERHGYRLVPLVKLGCGAFDVEQRRYGAPYPQCAAFRSWAMNQIEQLDPDVVVLAYRGLWEVKARAGESANDAWTNGVTSTVRRLREITPNVTVLSDIAALSYSPDDCLTSPHATMATCTDSEQPEMLLGNELTRNASTRVGASFVDVTDLVCLNNRCPLVVGRVITYHDDSHLTATWSDMLTDELDRRVGLSR